MQATVSVIIPTYNREQLVRTAIDSVLQQSYPDTEIVIIDDGSTDATRDSVAGYGDRVRYFHQENRGIAGARNAGIRAARGSYIAFLDSDDYWKPEKLARQMQLFAKHPEYGLVACQCASVRVDGSYREKNRPGSSGWVLRELFHKNFIRTSSAVIRAACFDRVGLFDERLRECEEYDLWMRIAARYPIGFINESLAVYVDNLDGASVDSLTGRLYRLQTLEKEYLRDSIPPPQYNRRIADTCHYIGRHQLKRGNRTEGLRYLQRAYRLRPLYVKNLFYLGCCLLRLV
jgi:glycosyltransferase involved in cell wall biosynthesis